MSSPKISAKGGSTSGGKIYPVGCEVIQWGSKTPVVEAIASLRGMAFRFRFSKINECRMRGIKNSGSGSNVRHGGPEGKPVASYGVNKHGATAVNPVAEQARYGAGKRDRIG